MKPQKNMKLSSRISMLSAIIVCIGMFILWLITINNASYTVNTDLNNLMTDAVSARAEIIEDYVKNAEDYMKAFSLSPQIRELLKDPENPELIAAVQKYDEEFAAVKGIFEGLYVGTPETHIRTHNQPEVVGIITRPGDKLAPFQQSILSKKELTNLGIMASPATGDMIISMYYPIFEEEKCIGYIGGAVYAEDLMNELDKLPIPGQPSSEYVFINASDGMYLYNKNSELINTPTEESGYLQIMDLVKAGGNQKDGNITYKDENGTNWYVAYKYLPDRDWIFMIRTNKTEMDTTMFYIDVIIGAVCAAIAAAIIIAISLFMRKVGRDLDKVETAISSLGQLKLNADKDLKPLYHRNDEIGRIANTTHELCERLRLTIDDIRRILGEMADGNIAVDVEKNASYYIGNFAVLEQSLKTIRGKLLKLTRNIAHVSGRVAGESENVSHNVVSLSHGISTQEASVTNLNVSMEDISAEIRASAANCSEAQKLTEKTASYTEEADQKMERLTSAMNNIAKSSTEIEKIIHVIEDIAFQTNILALNAAVEAARAGTTGKGFAVVADEVRTLAAKSAEAAKDSTAYITRSIKDVQTGTEATSQMAEIMRVIGECTESIKGQMHEIAAASSRQSKMISDVSKEIQEISGVVQHNTTDVNESVVTLHDLSSQAKELNKLVGQFHTDKDNK